MNALKRLASRLPTFWQQELKRFHYRRQIRRGVFETQEPEFKMLDQLVSDGDWVIDVGANIGHYTKRLSDLVGPRGRVIAVEPVPNAAQFAHRNVTLLNLAASNQTAVVGIQIPNFDTGLKNYYRAAITTHDAELNALALAVDSLALGHHVSLVKIDAEGHDPVVLEGMERLLKRDHPTVIVETSSAVAHERMAALGYRAEVLPGSTNALFRMAR